MPDNAPHPAPSQEDTAAHAGHAAQASVEARLSDAEVRQVALMISAAELALPVPPPEVLKGYQDLYPEAAQKFFQWAEEEGQHRRALDDKLAESQIEDSRRGITCGLVVSLAGLALAAFAVWMHEPWVAGIIGGGTLVALARAFIVGKNLALRRSEKKTPEDN